MSAGRTAQRHRAVEASYVQTLYNSLTVDQLRTALAQLGKGPQSARTHEEVVSAIGRTGHTKDEIAQALLDIEARTPTPHCLLTTYSGVPPKKVTSAGPVKLPPSSPDVSFRLVYDYHVQDLSVITAEHHVEVEEWEAVDSNNKVRHVSKLRHPIIIRLYQRSNLALLCYPGYSQGSGGRNKHSLHYETLLSRLIEDLSLSYDISFSPMNLEACISTLGDGSSNRVRIFRASLEHAKGSRLNLTSPLEGKSVSDLLFDFIAPHFPGATKADLRRAVNEALREASASTIVGQWVRENVITRIRFWTIGADFLWHGTDSSYRAIETILELLAAVSTQLERPGNADVWNAIRSLGPGDFLLPASFASRFSLAKESLRQTLVRATDAGLLEPVYRLRVSEDLEDDLNEWTPKLSSLARMFTTETGQKVDGTNPDMIEVAFRRVGEVQNA